MPSKRSKKLGDGGVDYAFATEAAHEFIKKYGVDWLPVDIFELVDNYAEANNVEIRIVTIEELSEETKIDRQSLIDDVIYGEDGLAIYDPDTGKYSIVINEQVEPYGRIRWTVAHELGHIVLGHLSSSKVSITKWSLSDEEYNKIEQEAHIFAGELLAPKFIVYRIGCHASAELQDICGLSGKAADSRERAIRELIDDKRKLHDSMLSIIPPFTKFLEFRTICADESTLRIHSRIQRNPEPELPVFLPTPDINKDGRYAYCPNCGNAHIAEEALFCKLCGTHLFAEPISHPTTPCGYIGDKDARYCEQCGGPVYKTRFGLLFDRDEI
ncbi:MAG: ImmA/IrrE family metallo-endopeptidase [Peptococcaceae bacterium]|nr:ImmA/IrrE family metallo-endopeptidase [Peptococcaceae bacterium]